jgi:hypothetical protein
MKLDDAYVRLERRFTEVHKDHPLHGHVARSVESSASHGQTSCPPQAPAGVDRSAVVVLAPSGQGKSVELGAYAARLHAAGVATFLMRAQDLSVNGVPHAVADPAAFRAWQESPTEAVFFVDAVDEARLAGHDLERLMLRFAREVDPTTRKIRLVLSSRNDISSAGRARHVSKALALPEVADAALATTTPSLVRIVRLEPLSPSDVQVLAKANGGLMSTRS